MILFDVGDVVEVRKTGKVLSVVDLYSDGVFLTSYFCTDGEWYEENELRSV